MPSEPRLDQTWEVNSNELRHLVYKFYGVRVHPNAPREHLLKLLNMETRRTAQHELNNVRNRIQKFVTENKDRLSLFCDGNCYQHSDGVVLSCYKYFMEGLDQ